MSGAITIYFLVAAGVIVGFLRDDEAVRDVGRFWLVTTGIFWPTLVGVLLAHRVSGVYR